MPSMVPLFSKLCVLFGIASAVPVKTYYATKYDHIDVETILNNRRMVNYYAACLLQKGPCPPEGVEFKRILPEALHTNCLRCTEKQKTVTLRTIRRLRKEYPKIWSQLQSEWDPDGTYIAKFENSFSNYMEAEPSIPVTIADRFADESAVNISENAVGSVSPSSTGTTSSTSGPTTVSKPRTTKKITSTTQKVIKTPIASTESTLITANKTIATSTISNTYFSPIPVPYVPLTNFGAGIQATVSLGTNIVGEFVRGIGVIGDRVVQTGAQIAEVVLKNIARPL